MSITPVSLARLRQFAPNGNARMLEAVEKVFNRLAPGYYVTGALRPVHFLAQIAHESAGFTAMVENLSYSEKRIGEVWPRLKGRAGELARNPEKLANAAYADRNGNGDEASGDGWLYRGRGPMQITGRGNYRRIGLLMGVDLESFPDMAAEPGVGLWAAFAYWSNANCNESADLDDVQGVTRRINGPALAGLEDRKRLTARAKQVFADAGTV